MLSVRNFFSRKRAVIYKNQFTQIPRMILCYSIEIFDKIQSKVVIL